MLSCHCLNVIIETEDALQDVEKAKLGLSGAELADTFFGEEVRQVGKLVNINKSHSGLIETRNVGSWVVHYCINCGVHSHAVHREKGASCVLVNPKLLTKSAIEKLRLDHNFSKFYKILVSGVAEEDFTPNSYVPTDVENVIRGFRQIAADALKKEAEAVEERIRIFSDQQYNNLSELRDRTFKEQQILTKIVLKSSSESPKPESTNQTMSANPQGIPSRLNEPLAAGSVKPAIVSGLRHTPKRQKSLPVGRAMVWNELSYDAEGLFDLEGAEESRHETASEAEETDGEETAREEGVKIPRRSGSSFAVAKSLPMTIPAFLSRNRSFEDVEDVEPIEKDATDIAASIKALAKSVHGDTVFGDLPKPRYTYI